MLYIALLLLAAWVLLFIAFKITVVLIHLLIILAIIAVAVHYFRKAKSKLSS
jgi:hypothetical protein